MHTAALLASVPTFLGSTYSRLELHTYKGKHNHIADNRSQSKTNSCPMRSDFSPFSTISLHDYFGKRVTCNLINHVAFCVHLKILLMLYFIQVHKWQFFILFIHTKNEFVMSWAKAELWWELIIKVIPHMILIKTHRITCSSRTMNGILCNESATLFIYTIDIFLDLIAYWSGTCFHVWLILCK